MRNGSDSRSRTNPARLPRRSTRSAADSGKRPPIAKIVEIARSHGAGDVVLGLPLELDGSESEYCGEIRRIGSIIEERLGVPVHFVDERMSSVRAERAVRSIGLPKAKREDKARVDSAAAALILQDWLNGRREVP